MSGSRDTWSFSFLFSLFITLMSHLHVTDVTSSPESCCSIARGSRIKAAATSWILMWITDCDHGPWIMVGDHDLWSMITTCLLTSSTITERKSSAPLLLHLHQTLCRNTLNMKLQTGSSHVVNPVVVLMCSVPSASPCVLGEDPHMGLRVLTWDWGSSRGTEDPHVGLRILTWDWGSSRGTELYSLIRKCLCSLTLVELKTEEVGPC